MASRQLSTHTYRQPGCSRKTWTRPGKLLTLLLLVAGAHTAANGQARTPPGVSLWIAAPFTSSTSAPEPASTAAAASEPRGPVTSSNAPAESIADPAVILPPPPLTTTTVEVNASSTDIAAAQVSLEEKQRVLGFFPNFYAAYLPNAEPLTPRQKVHMAWKTMTDPVAFGTTAFVAGYQQSQNSFRGYGQGTAGYAKRFGAVYADGFTSTMLGGAILPTVLRQDPRYFVKGTGSTTSRALYAVASTVVCKGDNGRWQPNYSNVLGNIASAGISNLYYPSSDRHGAGLTVQNSLIQTAFGAFGSLMQEFVLRRMTPNVPDYGATGVR